MIIIYINYFVCSGNCKLAKIFEWSVICMRMSNNVLVEGMEGYQANRLFWKSSLEICTKIKVVNQILQSKYSVGGLRKMT